MSWCAIGLDNPKSPGNVGSIIRSCGCFAADEIFYTGERYDRAQKFHTDTANARATLPLTHKESLFISLPEKTQTVCVELVENAIALPQFQHPEHCLYVFGPEDNNLTQQCIDQCDQVVFIPARHCLNLSATVNIVLYDRWMKSQNELSKEDYNQMIRTSRDCRNNLSTTA